MALRRGGALQDARVSASGIDLTVKPTPLRPFLTAGPSFPWNINVDDEYGRRLARDFPEAITFNADDELAAELHLRGRFNRENALAAAAAARAVDVAEDAIRRGIEAVREVPGRFGKRCRDSEDAR